MSPYIHSCIHLLRVGVTQLEALRTAWQLPQDPPTEPAMDVTTPARVTRDVSTKIADVSELPSRASFVAKKASAPQLPSSESFVAKKASAPQLPSSESFVTKKASAPLLPSSESLVTNPRVMVNAKLSNSSQPAALPKFQQASVTAAYKVAESTQVDVSDRSSSHPKMSTHESKPAMAVDLLGPLLLETSP